jgi:hypothetical protein
MAAAKNKRRCRLQRQPERCPDALATRRVHGDRSFALAQKLITTSLNLQNGGKVVMRYCSKATLHEHEIYQALKISPVPLNKIRMTQM